jgi:hypothetical protein
LQAKNVGPDRFDKFGDQIDAQPHRIDIPGCDFDLHRREYGLDRQLNQHSATCHHPRRRMIQYPQAIASYPRRGAYWMPRLRGA